MQRAESQEETESQTQKAAPEAPKKPIVVFAGKRVKVAEPEVPAEPVADSTPESESKKSKKKKEKKEKKEKHSESDDGESAPAPSDKHTEHHDTDAEQASKKAKKAKKEAEEDSTEASTSSKKPVSVPADTVIEYPQHILDMLTKLTYVEFNTTTYASFRVLFALVPNMAVYVLGRDRLANSRSRMHRAC